MLMSGSTVRSWFTPQLIITLAMIALSASAAWFGIKSDVRSMSEEQTRQSATLTAQTANLTLAIDRLDKKIPDGAVIDEKFSHLYERIGNLEKLVDPVAQAEAKINLARLMRDFPRLDTYVRGRIDKMPWHSPAFLTGD